MYATGTCSRQLPENKVKTHKTGMKNKTLLLPIYLTLTRALLLVISPGHAFSGEGNSFQAIKYFRKVYYISQNVWREKCTLLPVCKITWEE